MDVDSNSPHRLSRKDAIHACLLILIVGAIYGARLGALPLHGEESRWARGAVLMMETGDWIVPRQQYQVFPERPPLNSWAMAGVAIVRGQMDEVAVRLPSVIAIVLTTLLVFLYARTFLSTVGALASAGAFATMGQVLQIGRLGESESVFTLFIASSMLLWHWGYRSKWPRLLMWVVAYAAVGLGALTKGIQAPVYFAAAVGLYLLVRRDWRTAISWQHVVGIGVFVGIVGAWQIPFMQRAEWSDTMAIWFGLASDRVGTGGLLEHMASYPIETMVCLMPWSLLLLQLLYQNVRQSVGQSSDHLLFLLVAVAITYPSVWLSIGAKGRYFMPLYPCIAIIVGMVVQASVQAAKQSSAHRGWIRFLMFSAALSFALAIFTGVAGQFSIFEPVALSGSTMIVTVVLTLLCAGTLFWASQHPQRASYAIYSMVVFMGIAYAGVALTARERTRSDLASMIDAARAKLPQGEQLISIGAVNHRFCFYYRDSIPQVNWPEHANEVPSDVEYFCFERRVSDTKTERFEGRGRSWRKTSSQLPFDWQEIAQIPSDSRAGKNPRNCVVIARRVKPTVRVADREDQSKQNR